MKTVIKFMGLVTLFSLFISGCATNRGIVSLKLPESATSAQPNGKQVYIKSVKDQRKFEVNPFTPDIPSLGFGGADNASDSLKKRAIARKRNTYGKALGDIVLEESQTVETVIADALKQSLGELGYQVVDNPDSFKKDAITLDVEIQKFWAWMSPGFWALTLRSEISTKLLVTASDSKTKEIHVRTEGNYQVASGKNWLAIIHKSLQKYMNETKVLFPNDKN